MSKRTYNIYFHLHTVSGILITIGLHVIFFAGAFSLFLDELQRWETDQGQYPTTSVNATHQAFSLDKLVHAVEANGHDLYGRKAYIDIGEGAFHDVYLSGSADSLAAGEAKKSKSLRIDSETYEVTEKNEGESSTIANLLYELHFFDQLGDFGYYLSGVVSLFFLFAMVSGIIVHWKKIISNFYIFRPYEKLKTVWTDAHTALGTIGIPFQFMYAVTGAMFGLGVLIATSGSVLYGGDESKFYDDVYGKHSDSLGNRINLRDYRLDSYLDSASSRWQNFKTTFISLSKTGSSTMQMTLYGEISSKTKFFNDGEVVFNVVPGTIDHFHDPYDVDYDAAVDAAMHRLHFGQFSLPGWQSTALRVIYFLLAIATCFVIITGVLIWLEARNKNNVPDKEKKFNEGVGHIYLAICLTMFPVTAFSLIASKVIPETMADHKSIIINSVFFGGWLMVSIFFWLKKNNYFTNKYTLLSAGILGLCIPVVNGVTSGNWFWRTLTPDQHQVFFIDVLWVILAAFSLSAVFMMKKQNT